MIYHIYWGTSGNSGLYLDGIYSVLKDEGYEQKAFVNYYYPFNYGEKIFFKRGDIAYGNIKGKTRKIFQLIEVLKGYFIILCKAIQDRPQLINYSHVGQSYYFVPLFLKILKFVSGSRLMVTCHDVAPHCSGRSEMKYRRLIFNIADLLLVHNYHSRIELANLFGVDTSKVVEHLFPVMDLSKLSMSSKKYESVDFLFIGHVRQDKGAQLLIDAWLEFHRIHPSATLRICGGLRPGIFVNKELLEKSNVELNLHFISDEDYSAYVKSTRYVILPYLQGTNSGIISTVLSLGADVITSDIKMFSENPLISIDDMFRNGDSKSLLQKLSEKFMSNDNTDSKKKIKKYNEEFERGVKYTYFSILNKYD